MAVHLSLLFSLSCVVAKSEVNNYNGSVHNLSSGLVYSSIQAAIEAPETVAGDTILVGSGIYRENIVLTKSVHLFGENRSNTVIFANTTGDTVTIRASNSEINGFSIRGGFSGVVLSSVDNCTVSDNEVVENRYGIVLTHAHGNVLKRNVIAGNSYNFYVSGRWLADFINDVDSSNTVDGKLIYYWVNKHDVACPLDAGYVAAINCTDIRVQNLRLTGNGHGILFAFVSNSTIENVEASGNYDGIWISDSKNITLTGNDASHNYRHGMELERLMDCKIIQNVARENGYEDYGIRLAYSSNVSLKGNIASGNKYGIVVQFSEDCRISQNNASNNRGMGIWPKFCEECTFTENIACGNGFYGIEPEDSQQCVITGNNFSANGLYGIWLLGALDTCDNHIVTHNYLAQNKAGIGLRNSSFNLICHNNFIQNEHQAVTRDSTGNSWTTDSEGNYWSDYNGFDADYNGIGDTAYQIDENNTDEYPLMGMFTSFKTSQDRHVEVTSNSTITDLEIFKSNSTVRIHVFNVSASRPIGFCRTSIPKDLASPPFSVEINDGPTEIVYLNENAYDNGTHRWIYVAYREPTNQTNLIPVILVASLSGAAILIAVSFLVRKQRRKKNTLDTQVQINRRRTSMRSCRV